MSGIWKETSPTLPAGGPMTPFCSEISQGRSWQMFLQAEKDQTEVWGDGSADKALAGRQRLGISETRG